MKKLMFVATAAFCGAVMAAGEITSANVVGYNSVAQIKGGRMNLLCVSWETIGAEGKALLNDVMDTSKLLSFSEDAETAGDYIDTWDMSNGNWGPRYYYVDQGESEDWGPEYADTWMNIDFDPVNPEVDPGLAFWLYANNDIDNFAFNGQVVTDGVAYTLTAGRMNLCANPYPATLNLNNKNQVVLTGKTSFSEDAETAGDYIDTWDLTAANWGPRYYYVDQGESEDWGPEYADTWMDIDFGVVEDTALAVGTGFWYNAKDTVTLTFVSPISK